MGRLIEIWKSGSRTPQLRSPLLRGHKSLKGLSKQDKASGRTARENRGTLSRLDKARQDRGRRTCIKRATILYINMLAIHPYTSTVTDSFQTNCLYTKLLPKSNTVMTQQKCREKRKENPRKDLSVCIIAHLDQYFSTTKGEAYIGELAPRG